LKPAASTNSRGRGNNGGAEQRSGHVLQSRYDRDALRLTDRLGWGEKMNETSLLSRITVNPAIFGGKPIVRGRRLAVEHVLGMLAAGDSVPTILEGYPWLEAEDVQACLVYARRLVGRERIEPLILEPVE
jgi:uncharacterized protein (DUF433 family)